MGAFLKMSKERNAISSVFVYLLTFVMFCAVFLFWRQSYLYFEKQNDWGLSGTIGDSFGAINALFSGLAFVGLICTLLMQKKELGYQREDLEETRTVMASQLEEMRSSKRLQSQPLIVVARVDAELARPLLSYSQDKGIYTYLPTFKIRYSLLNKSHIQAISLVSKIAIHCPGNKKIFKFDSKYTDCLCQNEESEIFGHDYLDDKLSSLYQCFDSRNGNDYVVVYFNIVYKNISLNLGCNIVRHLWSQTLH